MAGKGEQRRMPWRDAATRIGLFFDLDNNGSDFRTEILAGLTTFLATMYIIAVNPAIVQAAGMPASGVMTATILVSTLASIGMGLYARNPIVVAPGMSLNHLFAYSVVKAGGVPWETALGCVFWSGVLFFLLACCDRRKWLVNSIPRELRFGFAGGMPFSSLRWIQNWKALSAGGARPRPTATNREWPTCFTMRRGTI